MKKLLDVVGKQFKILKIEMEGGRYLLPNFYNYKMVYAYKGKIKGPVTITGSSIADATNRFLVDFMDTMVPEFEDKKKFEINESK